MDTFKWRNLSRVDWEQFSEVRTNYHHAVQYVSAVGRRFSPHSKKDHYAYLSWVPGLSRLAGNWVKGNITFRSSIGFQSFQIFLVDEQALELSTIDLNNKTQRQLMLWLEEQIGKYGLKASNLAMKLPYKLSSFENYRSSVLHVENPDLGLELGNYFHNAYILFRDFKSDMNQMESINIRPKRFDLAMDVIVKDSGDPETTSKITLGMYPGDVENQIPYFYVSSWPHINIEQCQNLTFGHWFSEDWTGAVLSAIEIIENDQQSTVVNFYKEAAMQLEELLTK